MTALGWIKGCTGEPLDSTNQDFEPHLKNLDEIYSQYKIQPDFDSTDKPFNFLHRCLGFEAVYHHKMSPQELSNYQSFFERVILPSLVKDNYP